MGRLKKKDMETRERQKAKTALKKLDRAKAYEPPAPLRRERWNQQVVRCRTWLRSSRTRRKWCQPRRPERTLPIFFCEVSAGCKNQPLAIAATARFYLCTCARLRVEVCVLTPPSTDLQKLQFSVILVAARDTSAL